jgi:hypothetical protein
MARWVNYLEPPPRHWVGVYTVYGPFASAYDGWQCPCGRERTSMTLPTAYLGWWFHRIRCHEHTFESHEGNEAETAEWVERTAHELDVSSKWGWTDWLPLLWRIENSEDRDATLAKAREMAEYAGPSNVADLLWTVPPTGTRRLR